MAGPWSTQTRALVGLLGWIVAVLAGTWAYRGESRRAASATRWLLLLGIVAMAGAATLVFISLGVREVLAGTVIFGASGTGCEIEGEAEIVRRW